ncbi:MAG: YgiT-type zinc finger protein [Anaerolineae bacterium]
MICEFCGGETAKRKVQKYHWFKGRLFIVDNVEAEVCQQCGERYYHAKTLDAIDHLLEGEYIVKARLEVEVVAL